MKIKNCKSCEKEFEIQDKDIVFYEQVNVPEPLSCPDCRMIRRLAFRNERTLYKRPCDLCKKDGISIYAAGTAFPVYCHTCWWSDNWDPKSYATEYDPSLPFMEQMSGLLLRVPRVALLVVNSVRSEYTNSAGDNKDCYLIFAADGNEDSAYSRLIMKCKQVFDCSFTYDSELCYECIDCRQCYNCLHSEQCQSSTDLLFCYDMRNSQNCIFCTNGRNVTYSIFNKKCTKEEFDAKKAEIFSSPEKLKEAKKEYEKLKASAITKYAVQIKCHNVTGDYMFNCFDGSKLFDVSNAKDSSYIADSEDPIDCQDCNNIYYKPELCYQVMGALQNFKSKCSKFVMYCSEVEYCDSCYNLTSSFGCIAVRKGQYMILNKQYDKETYEQLKETIVVSMKKDATYGEFFPASTSHFSFNETIAKEYFPLTKEEALAKGFRWQDEVTGTYGKETIVKGAIPSNIESVDDSILNEVLVCEECDKNFRITKMELDFYKRMNIPLPLKDFECRHKARTMKRNPRKLWQRSCMCEMKNHPAHSSVNCTNEFETSYSPDRQETVYCEQCYQQEVS